jgi:acyl-CoA synthetase (AMP-forming)/AMP-acid ligase II
MTTVLMERWSPSEALRLIEDERVTFMVGPPTFFVDLMDDPSFDPSKVLSLRLVSSGGAGVSPQFVERASTTLGSRVKRSYGSTEAPTVATALSSDDPIFDREFDGHAIGDAQLRIVDGELLVRGPELFAGYLGDDEGAFEDGGWFRTGDLATLTEDGWLTITGRVKEIIIRAGENISIGEVEAALEAHPSITRAAVVGVRHDRLGEQVAAAVTTTGGDFTVDDCRRWFESRGLATYKTPEIVVCVDELPLMATGKIDREQLRKIVAANPG